MNVPIITADDARFRQVESLLARAGYSVGRHADCTGFLHEQSLHHDVILIDLGSAESAGFDAIKRIREGGIHSPIIALSKCGETTSTVRALGLGADDYIFVPFDEHEFIARVRAVARRSLLPADEIIKTGSIEVNLVRKTVKVIDNYLKLTPKEFLMLELLSLRKGSVLTKDMFVDYLYDGIDEPKSSIMELVMCRLRKKLNPYCGGHDYIHTVRGVGYMLSECRHINQQR